LSATVVSVSDAILNSGKGRVTSVVSLLIGATEFADIPPIMNLLNTTLRRARTALPREYARTIGPDDMLVIGGRGGVVTQTPARRLPRAKEWRGVLVNGMVKRRLCVVAA
jgi:hypothetical protein